jgi:hypothetical protein
MHLRAQPYYFFPLAVGLLGAHVIALILKLYYYWPWFDLVMHAWGGFLVVTGFLMFEVIGSRRLAPPRWSLPLLLGLVMAAWEIFEFIYGVAGTHPSYLEDTTLDTLLGIVGGSVAYVIFGRTRA